MALNYEDVIKTKDSISFKNQAARNERLRAHSLLMYASPWSDISLRKYYSSSQKSRACGAEADGPPALIAAGESKRNPILAAPRGLRLLPRLLSLKIYFSSLKKQPTIFPYRRPARFIKRDG